MSQLEAPSAEFKITSANRQAVKDWLAAQGFDATRVQSMRDQTLLKAYTDPRYLRALTNRGDYNPSVERNGTCLTSTSTNVCPASCDTERQLTPQQSNTPCARRKTGASLAETSKPLSVSRAENLTTRPSQQTNNMAEARLSSAPAGPENTQGVTEARVIELIRALAVLKPGLDVATCATDWPKGLEGLEDLL